MINQGIIFFTIGNEESIIFIKDKNKFPQAKLAIWVEVDNVKESYHILQQKGVIFLSDPFKTRTGWAV